ncbi:MAG: hypothetical protein DRQ88_06060 [Epsilonproteobacteria bacterium]|nr:MAG: hypothetical protein DRQ88_06060 [Campylobacterota bacterium]
MKAIKSPEENAEADLELSAQFSWLVVKKISSEMRKSNADIHEVITEAVQGCLMSVQMIWEKEKEAHSVCEDNCDYPKYLKTMILNHLNHLEHIVTTGESPKVPYIKQQRRK